MTRFSLDGALAVCAAIWTSSWIGSSSFLEKLAFFWDPSERVLHWLFALVRPARFGGLAAFPFGFLPSICAVYGSAGSGFGFVT